MKHDVLPQSSVSATSVPFHVYHDAEFLSEEGTARFFMNPQQFAKSGARNKVFEECNLGTQGSCIPDGRVKFVRWISLQVEGAMAKDEFEVTIVLAQSKLPTLKVKSGHSCAVEVTFAHHHDQEKGVFKTVVDEKHGMPLKLLPLGNFLVEVKGPKKHAGAYAKLSLHGPIEVAS